MQSQILFIVIHMSLVMTLAILGNLFLIIIIIRGNTISKRKISPVQVNFSYSRKIKNKGCIKDIFDAPILYNLINIYCLDYQ